MLLNSEYILTTDSSNLPLTTEEVNNHLKTSFSDITSDVYISLLIRAVQKYGEKFTKREFLTKTFTAYFKNWCSRYEIRKSSLVQIDSVKYLDADAVTQTVDSSDYFTTPSTQFSSLQFNEDYDYSSLDSNNPYPVIIQLKAGYGETEASIPKELKLAMLHHLARLYQHRGDCIDASIGIMQADIIEKALPVESRLIYSIYRIQDVLI